MKFNVHAYVAVRLKPESIEAESVEDAIVRLTEEIDVPYALRHGEAEDDESAPLGYLVDPLDDDGEILYDEASYVAGSGAHNYIETDFIGRVNQLESAAEFVRLIARMATTEESDMTQEDAFMTIDDLIASARAVQLN